MYYNLTKDQYKEYKKNFNKTYIGKYYNNTMISAVIVGGILWAFVGFKLGISADKTTKLSLYDVILTIVGGFTLLEGCFWQIFHTKELKKYIIENNKK